MNSKIMQNHAGFSLIELLVAVTIFSIGLLATAGMQITALQSNASAHKITTINTIAAGILEEIMTWAPDDPRLTVSDPSVAYLWDFDRSTPAVDPLSIVGGGTFEARYFVDADFPVEKVSTVRLEVSSSGGLTSFGGNSRTLTIMKKVQ